MVVFDLMQIRVMLPTLVHVTITFWTQAHPFTVFGKVRRLASDIFMDMVGALIDGMESPPQDFNLAFLKQHIFSSYMNMASCMSYLHQTSQTWQVLVLCVAKLLYQKVCLDIT